MTNTLSLFLAVLLDRKSWMRGPYRAIIFLPYILSPVVTGFIFEVLLSPNIGVVIPGLVAILACPLPSALDALARSLLRERKRAHARLGHVLRPPRNIAR